LFKIGGATLKSSALRAPHRLIRQQAMHENPTYRAPYDPGIDAIACRSEIDTQPHQSLADSRANRWLASPMLAERFLQNQAWQKASAVSCFSFAAISRLCALFPETPHMLHCDNEHPRRQGQFDHPNR
jgi:hypothetical protein